MLQISVSFYLPLIEIGTCQADAFQHAAALFDSVINKD